MWDSSECKRVKCRYQRRRIQPFAAIASINHANIYNTVISLIVAGQFVAPFTESEPARVDLDQRSCALTLL